MRKALDRFLESKGIHEKATGNKAKSDQVKAEYAQKASNKALTLQERIERLEKIHGIE